MTTDSPRKRVAIFFASSTDHTRLLAEAEVHCWVVPSDNNNSSSRTQYVLVVNGIDLEMVKRGPQLHLTCLFVTSDQRATYGVKVVNRAVEDLLS